MDDAQFNPGYYMVVACFATAGVCTGDYTSVVTSMVNCLVVQCLGGMHLYQVILTICGAHSETSP